MRKNVIGIEEIKEAYQTMKKYKDGKATLEQRIVNEELFWKMRHWEAVKSKEGKKDGPTSAWLFNSIANNTRNSKLSNLIEYFENAYSL